MKDYHILDGVLPLSLSHIAGHIYKVIGYLTNFHPPLVLPAPRPSCSEERLYLVIGQTFTSLSQEER